MAFGRDRDLYKTKLCTLFLQRGHCPRQTCSFAHGGAELRRTPGRFEERSTGNRFDRHSPGSRLRRSQSRERRGRGFGHRSPVRDRGISSSPAKRRRSRSPSPPESSECKRRSSKNIRSEANDTHPSDVSAENIGTDSAGADKDVKARSRSTSFHLQDTLEEELGELHNENKVLLDQKMKLELVLESKLQETTELSDKVTMLDEKLAGAQEECKGLTSKTKKLVKVYKGFIRAQEDLKKAQGKLIKLVEDVMVDSYSKANIDLDSMKAMLPGRTSDLGDYESIHTGTFAARKEGKVDASILAEGRTMFGIGSQNYISMQEKKALWQSGLLQCATSSDNIVSTLGERKNLPLGSSGNVDGLGHNTA